MICEHCKANIKAFDNFCSNCGAPLKQIQNLAKSLEKDYKNPYGTWLVTTEADCEGRGTLNYGYHEGYIDEIAKRIVQAGKRVEYSLRFKKINMEEEFAPKVNCDTIKEVNISLDEESGLTILHPENRVATMAYVLKDRPVEVKENINKSIVTLKFED